MRKAVAYCRVSTKQQGEDDRYGLDEQREDIQLYANENDIEITQWFVDKISGAKDNRPEFDKILNGEITNPPIQCVVVGKSDRVARDVDLYFGYKYLLKRQNLELISVSEDFGKMGTFAPVYEAFTAVIAQLERDTIKARTSGGRRQKAKRGGYSGGAAPYGYTVHNSSLIVEPIEAQAVCDIYRMSESGATLAEIADEMNKRGLITHRGGKFATSTVQTILNNRKTYEGFYKYGKDGEWVKGQHEAILEDG